MQFAVLTLEVPVGDMLLAGGDAVVVTDHGVLQCRYIVWVLKVRIRRGGSHGSRRPGGSSVRCACGGVRICSGSADACARVYVPVCIGVQAVIGVHQ